MKLKIFCIVILFLLVGCSYYYPIYVVNESNSGVRLELTLESLSDTSELNWYYINDVDRSKEFNIDDADSLKFYIVNDSVIMVDIPAKTMLYLSGQGSPKLQTKNTGIDVVRQFKFVQKRRYDRYDLKTFTKELKGKHWYSFLGFKSYFIYK